MGRGPMPAAPDMAVTADFYVVPAAVSVDGPGGASCTPGT
jgi:hypothetical protein